MSKTVLDREGVFEKYGVYPERVIDYLALMGDKIDNVPGINKCGPKTAAKWIAEYGSLDNLVANADSVKGKIGEYLREGIPFLDLAKKLVTISTQAPVTFDPVAFAKKDPDAQALARFYARWEMSSSAGRRAARTPKKVVPTMTPDLFAAPSIPTEGAGETTPAPVSVRLKKSPFWPTNSMRLPPIASPWPSGWRATAPVPCTMRRWVWHLRSIRCARPMSPWRTRRDRTRTQKPSASVLRRGLRVRLPRSFLMPSAASICWPTPDFLWRAPCTTPCS